MASQIAPRPASDGQHTTASSTLRAILSQFGLERPGGIPHAAMVRAMRSLGITADAARQALSRAARSGALALPPEARRGEVLLSSGGREALAITEHDRGLSFAAEPWDGKWSILVLHGRASLSQPHKVRNQLLLEGLGNLGNGTWITPHSHRSERLVRILEADPDLSLIAGQVQFEHPSNREIAEQAWNLDALRAEYEAFRHDVAGLHATTDEESFMAWISVVRHWQHVTRLDPGIPEEAVGAAWPALGVPEIVAESRARWMPQAGRFFEQLVTDFKK